MTDAPELADNDARARVTALDPARSFIVQAPAGSGKTTVLTERLLSLLLTVDEPEEILAITFTRKAAAEMLGRVVAALRMMDAPASAHERSTWALAQQVRLRSAERGWRLESSANRLRIQTIDALHLSLAARLPVGAGVGGRLQVSDDVSDLYLRAAQRMLEDSEADPLLRPLVERLLLRTDNDWSRLVASFAAMLPLRAHWFDHLQTQDGEALRQRVTASLVSITTDVLRRAATALGTAALTQGGSVAHRAAANLRQDAEIFLDHWRAAPVALLPLVEQLPKWQELARFALRADLKAFRIRLTVTSGVPPKDDALKRDSRRWLQTLADTPGALEALREIAELPPPCVDDLDAAALEAISRLLPQASAVLQVLFAAAGRVDHVYVAGAARSALLSAGDPTELAIRLGNRLRHILVDEFQDTSVRQLQMLELLTMDWQPGDGRSLFLVGDPMQSIYLFRETDVGLFLQACRGALGVVPLTTLELRANFRSVPALVEFANETFGKLFPAHADARSAAVPHLSAIATRGAHDAGTSAIQMHCLDPGNPASEALCVRDIVARHLQQDSGQRVAVLVRSRSHAATISEELLSAGISVAGVELLPLAEVGVVQDLAALTRALRHDGDRIAWLAVLRAPWCGLSLADLEMLVRGAEKATVRELMAQADRMARLSEDGRTRLLRLRGMLDNGSLIEPQLPGIQSLESLWRALGGPAACADETELRHALRYFDVLAERVSRLAWPEPDELDAMLATLYAEPAPGVVQIMTVHKSKGLEFDVVILPGLNRGTGNDRNVLMRWVQLPRAQADAAETDLLIAPLTPADAEEADPLSRLVRRLRRRREVNEQVRLLYVAVTRAREALHLVGSLADYAGAVPKHGSALATLWPAIGAQFAASRVTATRTPAVQRPRISLRRLPADWCAPELDADPTLTALPVARVEIADRPEFLWVAETGRHVGTVVHAELQRASTMSLSAYAAELDDLEANEPRLERLLKAQGLEAALLAEARRRVVRALRATLADERGRWILGGNHREAHSEFALSGLYQGRLTQAVVDRWLVDDHGDCWVIDYKTSAHEGADAAEFLRNELRRYTSQLERYRGLSRGLGFKQVRAALYFPLLGEFLQL